MKKISFFIVALLSFSGLQCSAGELAQTPDDVKNAFITHMNQPAEARVPRFEGSDSLYKEMARKLGVPPSNLGITDNDEQERLIEKYARKRYRATQSIPRKIFHMPRWQHAAAGVGFVGLTGLGFHFMSKMARKLNWVALERHVLRQRLLEQFGHANHKELRARLKDDTAVWNEQLRIIAERYLQVDREFKRLNIGWWFGLVALLTGGTGSIVTGVKHYRSVPIAAWKAEAEKRKNRGDA